MNDTQPRTEAGREFWLSMTGGYDGPFPASARDIADRILAIEAEAANPISREALATALRKIDFDHDRDMLDNPEAEAERRKTADAILAALPPAPDPSESSDRLRAAAQEVVRRYERSMLPHSGPVPEAVAALRAALATTPAASPAAPEGEEPKL